jgi:hypothetical protein
VSCIRQTGSPLKRYSWRVLFLFALATLLGSCSTAATVEGMVPDSIETVTVHPQTVRVNVTGAQSICLPDSLGVCVQQITDAAFTKALTAAITKSRTFSKVIEDQSQSEDYLLTVTLFSMDKRFFGDTVTLEAGWTLRHTTTSAIVWRESIISQSTHSNLQQATEGAARNNIAQALVKVSKLNL